jgi:hypothetical protein
MTRTSCLSTISCAALLLAITGYGCGGASDSLPGAGTGGKTGNPGSGGSISGTGGIFGGGTGGIFGGTGGESGSGGTVGGSGGSSGRPDAAADGFQRPDGRADGFQRPDGQQRPDAVARDVVARDVVARDLFTRPEVAAADGGIPMCRANARCTVGNPPATCMEPCMIGTAAGERACTCVRPGIVACGLCRRAADGGAADSAGQ